MSDEETKQQRIELIQALGANAQACPACDLSQTRTKVVFGVGNPNSPLMLIGEGPGANEDATGEPFVGRAGKLLDECLREAGMKREHVYITNIVKCRASEILDGKVKNRVPTTDEVATCVPLWLEKQIEIIDPLVLLCLGSPAANTIIHKNFKITQERGQFQEGKYSRNSIAALHPAYILRLEGDAYARARQTLVDDLAAAKERAITAKREPKMTLF